MNDFVLDCSVTMCWCIDDEASPETEDLFHMARQATIFVPLHWHLEVSNALLNAERRKRLSRNEVEDRFDMLSVLSPMIDTESVSAAVWRETHALARTEKLTTYDAAYLELALRKGLPLATKDEDLIGAAGRSGVRVLPE